MAQETKNENERKEKAGAVLKEAVDQLLGHQNDDGTWTGKIMFNAWTNGMYAILHKVVGFDGEPTEILNWIEGNRTGLDEDGKADETWGIIDSPSLHHLESTIVCEIAMEIWGRGRNQKTWDFIDEQAEARLASAVSLTDPFTQVFSAMASEFRPAGNPPYYSLNKILAPPIELLIIPRFVKTSLPRLFAAWGQESIVAVAVITTLKLEKRLSMFKKVLLEYAESLLLSSQNEDGSWYDTALPSLGVTMAMYLLGYPPNHEVMKKAQNFLKKLQMSNGYMARFKLPVWDTALALIALRHAGVAADDHRLIKGANYLIDSVGPTGGIPFQKENVPYPDTDDTSCSLLALDLLNMGDREAIKKDAMKKGMEWLLMMQNGSGGYAAFTRDQSKKVKGTIPFFKDDPPTADVTGHVLSSLKLAKQLGFGEEAVNNAVADTIEWIKKMQMNDGEWFGRWGLTYTYGTTAILQGLYDIGEPMNQGFINHGVQYYLDTQQADGGWGEGFETYYNVKAIEKVKSTVSQTAWSLLGLLVTPQTPKVKEAIDRGIDFLIKKFKSGTGWGEAGYTVGALWVYKNTLYPLLWGVWALGLYLKNNRS